MKQGIQQSTIPTTQIPPKAAKCHDSKETEPLKTIANSGEGGTIAMKNRHSKLARVVNGEQTNHQIDSQSHYTPWTTNHTTSPDVHK
mmetsp:Transcript_12152/g.26511  ORF Transcript_12152/g.26511 Transcript_12152/m.26511 type:complete len:87 (-) Transcript_12152:84-344(-)